MLTHAQEVELLGWNVGCEYTFMSQQHVEWSRGLNFSPLLNLHSHGVIETVPLTIYHLPFGTTVLFTITLSN